MFNLLPTRWTRRRQVGCDGLLSGSVREREIVLPSFILVIIVKGIAVYQVTVKVGWKIQGLIVMRQLCVSLRLLCVFLRLLCVSLRLLCVVASIMRQLSASYVNCASLCVDYASILCLITSKFWIILTDIS